MREHDLILGKTDDGDFLRLGGGEHAVLHARSGTGKSAGFSIPNAFAWKGSLVCLDIKRELFDITAGYRAEQGQSVFLFDPAAEDGRSHRWNPFWQVARDLPERFDQIARMAFQLFPEVPGQNNGNNDFWNAAAAKPSRLSPTLSRKPPASRSRWRTYTGCSCWGRPARHG